MEFLEDDMELFKIAQVFLEADWKYTGMGAKIGKELFEIEKFLTYKGFEPKEWLLIVRNMARVWIGEENKNK